jgi:tRNA pseudouridine55 synthase
MIKNEFNNCILLIDKQEGLTSFQVVNKLKKLLQIKRIGHSGTLDKSATGLLVIATGYATKVLHYLLVSDKAYIGKVKLGIVTDSCDKNGEIIEKHSTAGITAEKIKEAVSQFKGEIEQIPPVFSALKINGKRASDLVRAGKNVELKKREVTIKDIEVKNINIADNTFDIHVDCSKGTYIRSLARDIGNILGTGAFLADLKRVKLGNFDLKDAILLDQFDEKLDSEKKFCYSPAEALDFMNKIILTGEGVVRAKNGCYFLQDQVKDLQKADSVEYAVFDEDKNLIAIADINIDNWHVKYKNVFNQI